MGKEINKVRFTSNRISLASEENRIKKVAKKLGVVFPSNHTGFFQTPLSPIDEPNNNGHELTSEAVDGALDKIVGSQVNINHNGKNWMCGIVYDAWINSSNEIECIFSFAKNIFAEEYLMALEQMSENKLAVSWEVSFDKVNAEKLDDGTIRLHEFNWDGIAVLIGKDPGYSGAIVYKMAELYRDRAIHDKECLFAEKIIEQCDQVLDNNEEDKDKVVYTFSEEDLKQFISEWEERNKKTVQKSKSEINKMEEKLIMTDEQKQKVSELRAELEGFLPKDTKDEQLLDEKFVAEIRTKMDEKSKEKAEEEASKEEKPAEEKTNDSEEKSDEAAEAAKETADSKSLSKEVYTVETTYKDDGTQETKASKDCTYTWVNSEGETQTETVKQDTTKTYVYAEDEVAEIKAEAKNELQAKVDELEATVASQAEELEAFQTEKAEREQAERDAKIKKVKASLKDNQYIAEFKDEDFLNEDKVAHAKLLQERDDLKAENTKIKEKHDIKDDDKANAEMETAAASDESESDVSGLINKAHRL